jgi:alcohol dehydrogenase
MQAIHFTQPKHITLADCPDASSPGPGEALVRTHRMGVCGTDLSGYLGKMPFFSYPRIPGHELGLEVLAVGEGVSHLHPGDRCSLEPYINDPASPISQKGSTNCCPGVQVLGVHTDGGLRTAAWIVPARKLHVGNQLTYDQLALVETLAIGKHAVHRGNPQPGETALVIGAGPIGLACLEFLKLMDVRVIVLDRVQSRLDFITRHIPAATTLLATTPEADVQHVLEATNGCFADLVIDATGSAASMSHCFEFAAFTGRVVYVGITTGSLSFGHAPIFHRRELTLLASRNALPADFPEIIRLIGDGKIQTDPWITHHIPFSEVPERFESLTDPNLGAIKAVISL